MTLKITVDIAFGLAFDVEKTQSRLSGFRPADVDLGSRKELFGEARLQGFAEMMRLGFAKKLILVGGNEGRYRDDPLVVNRAKAIKMMLEFDHGLNRDSTGREEGLIEAIPSASNTLGNIAIIKENIGDRPHRRCAVISNHYHLPRAGLDLVGAGLGVPTISAESFLLISGVWDKQRLLDELGGGPLAERMVEEIQGIADKLTGKYVSKTDIPIG